MRPAQAHPIVGRCGQAGGHWDRAALVALPLAHGDSLPVVGFENRKQPEYFAGMILMYPALSPISYCAAGYASGSLRKGMPYVPTVPV